MAKSANKKSTGRATKAANEKEGKKPSPKSKKQLEEDGDELEDDEEPVAKSSSKKTSSKSDDDDTDDDVEEVEDTWNKPEEEDSWDPDFDEFDIPKSKHKSTGASPKKGSKKGDEDDDFKLDDDFKEFGLFNDKGGGLDDDDDY